MYSFAFGTIDRVLLILQDGRAIVVGTHCLGLWWCADFFLSFEP